MSIYVTSDLHGMDIKLLKQLLNKVNFSECDWLYILGDVVDRQNDGGIEILKWLLEQSNAQLILGNHEAMLLSCEFIFNEITDDSINNYTSQRHELLLNYIRNGGDVTLNTLRELLHSSPDTVTALFEYLHEAPLYETVNIGDKDFLLVHSGLDNFSKDKLITDYTADELLWAWPEITDEYYDDIITVFGHTPTMSYDHLNKGKILKTKTWIDVDVGVPYGNSPALLRLDDLKEFYL
ncbi:MAG: calcineurin [Ruminococcaceae bacterium]|nr:calcineurin [Oscillospiraceae bacterium]